MATERERLFGADLRVEAAAGGMDLLPDTRGDLQLAGGNLNIAQALSMRLRVRRGELAPLGWPDYGSRLHELIGELNNNRTRVKLMALARAAIEQDPRVAEVQEVRAFTIPGERDTVRIHLEISLIDRPTPLNLVHDLRLEPA